MALLAVRIHGFRLSSVTCLIIPHMDLIRRYQIFYCVHRPSRIGMVFVPHQFCFGHRESEDQELAGVSLWLIGHKYRTSSYNCYNCSTTTTIRSSLCSRCGSPFLNFLVSSSRFWLLPYHPPPRRVVQMHRD